MIAVVIPAHNEAGFISACIDSVATAALDPALHGECVTVMVVADSCTDGTAEIAAARGALALSLNVRNVGEARAAGASAALAAGARWLAFTDADTLVAPDWLAAQLSHRADAVCGTVAVADWGA